MQGKFLFIYCLNFSFDRIIQKSLKGEGKGLGLNSWSALTCSWPWPCCEVTILLGDALLQGKFLFIYCLNFPFDLIIQKSLKGEGKGLGLNSRSAWLVPDPDPAMKLLSLLGGGFVSEIIFIGYEFVKVKASREDRKHLRLWRAHTTRNFYFRKSTPLELEERFHASDF